MPLSGKEQQRAIREIEESRKRGLYSSHTEETPQGNNWIGVFLVIVGLLMMGCAALMVLQLIK